MAYAGRTNHTVKTVSIQTATVRGRNIQLIRKPVKNMYLRIRTQDGAITVTAPTHIAERTIRDFIITKWDWIERSERALEANKNAMEESRHPRSWTPEAKQEARRELDLRLPALLRTWVPIVGREPSNISLRLMTTRWGSCTPATRRIRLNLELAWVEPQLLEYVLVHELTHLWASGHGAKFQRYMTTFMPDWKNRRRLLNRNHIG